MQIGRFVEEDSEVTWTQRNKMQAAKLSLAWGGLVGSIPWQLFVTLTFDPKKVFPVNAKLADKEAFWWFNQVARLVRLPIGWIYAVERGQTGMWHAHGLIVGLSRPIGDAAHSMWKERNGRLLIQSVDDSKRLTIYTTKQAALTGEIVCSDTLGRYRQPNTRSPWVVDLQPCDQRTGSVDRLEALRRQGG